MGDRKENIRKIKQSLDMMVYRRILIAVFIGLGLSVLYALAKFRDYEPVFFWIWMAWMGVFIVPMLCVWGWRMWKLFRAPEEYFFTNVKLENFHQNQWRRTMSFTVVIHHPQEGTIAVKTNPIFNAVGWEQPLLEDYLNKTVTIGYNRETDMVVVIG